MAAAFQIPRPVSNTFFESDVSSSGVREKDFVGWGAYLGEMVCAMSIGKQLTVVAVFQRIERGDFALTTPVADLIPEFGQRGKSAITIAHLLTHTGGLPMMLPPMAKAINDEASIAQAPAELRTAP